MTKSACSLVGACLLSVSFFAIICRTATSEEKNNPLTDTLGKILTEQEQAWNRGDIEAFMVPYWNSELLTFSSGGETQRGWNATRDRYKARYPDQKTMGKLRFSDLETQTLGPDSALMLGKWQLERDEPIGGNFTLVWRREKGRWFIVHDHTSARK